MLKERGFGQVRVDLEKGSLETDYVVQKDWRTKATATVRKINRREREVTLLLDTEKKSAGEWKPRKLMGPAQYDKLFYEIEMQIYREWSRPD